MRKILLFTLAVSVIAVISGCLKDKKFERQEYGIQIKEVKAVAFPQGPSSPNYIGVTAQSTPLTIDGPFITLEEDGNAKADVTVTLQINPSLVTAGGFVPLPVSAVTVNTLSPKIVAGSKITDIKLTFPNSAALNPSLEYGLGLTITAVDQGYKIAANKKDILLVFTVKNKYDGVYRLTMRSDGWAAYGIASGATGIYGSDIHLITAGANSVTLYTPPPFDWNLQSGFTGGVGVITGSTGFGATTPRYTVDVATNNVLSVVNTSPDDGRGRTLFLEASPTLPNKYDPVAKILYLEYYMTQLTRPNQKFFMSFAYLRPR
jgi:hypothetical protein